MYLEFSVLLQQLQYVLSLINRMSNNMGNSSSTDLFCYKGTTPLAVLGQDLLLTSTGKKNGISYVSSCSRDDLKGSEP